MALYVYALLDRAPRVGLKGIVREPIGFVRCGAGLVAAVGELSRAPAATVGTVGRHDRVVRRLAAAAPAALPARFGSTVADRAELMAMVGARRSDLRSALARVRGRVQMTLRAVTRLAGRPRARRRGSRATDLRTVRLQAHPTKVGVGTRYLRARLERSRRIRQAPELTPWRSAVAAFVIAEAVARSDEGPIIATAHHLIDRRSVRAYKAAIRNVGSASGDIWVSLSGPSPAYAFATTEGGSMPGPAVTARLR